MNLKKVLVFILFISLASAFSYQVFAEKMVIRVAVQQGNIRVKPSLESAVVGRAPMGAIFKVLEKKGEWFKVNLPPDEDGFIITGYIHSSIVEIVTYEKIEEKNEPETEKKEEKEVTKKAEEKGEEEKEARKPETPKVKPAPAEPPSSLPPAEPLVEEPAGRTGGISFGVKLSGGMSYLLLGNLNRTFDDRNVYIDKKADAGSIVGSYPNFHYGWDFGGEFILYFTPNIGIGLGADYLTAGYESGDVEWEISGTLGILTYTDIHINSTDINLTAIPLKLSLYFRIPMGSFMNLAFHAGGSYYLGTIKQKLNGKNTWYTIPWSFKDEVTANPTTFGFHGGLGLEFNISSAIALCLDVRGRYAKFSDIKGNYKMDDSVLGTGEEERIMYSYYYGPFDEYLGYAWDTTIPPKAEAATLDLTGADVKLGILIRF